MEGSWVRKKIKKLTSSSGKIKHHYLQTKKNTSGGLTVKSALSFEPFDSKSSRCYIPNPEFYFFS